jgi:hypothetical protein
MDPGPVSHSAIFQRVMRLLDIEVITHLPKGKDGRRTTARSKGRVERLIRSIRDSFFAARQWRDLDDLNAQAAAWCQGQGADRPCPEDRSMSVREAFTQEQPKLLALPENPFPTEEREALSADKTPYVRFDCNDYSIPSTHVRRTLTVVASPTEVRVLNGAALIAAHARSYEKGKQVEDPAHIAELTARKRQARQHRGTNRLAQAAPNSRELLCRAAERGENLGSITAALLRLLERYGATELQAGIAEALAREVPHPNAVRLALERRREQRNRPPPSAMPLEFSPPLPAIIRGWANDHRHAVAKKVFQGLSRMRGNAHVRFLGGLPVVRRGGYPT